MYILRHYFRLFSTKSVASAYEKYIFSLSCCVQWCIADCIVGMHKEKSFIQCKLIRHSSYENYMHAIIMLAWTYEHMNRSSSWAIYFSLSASRCFPLLFCQVLIFLQKYFLQWPNILGYKVLKNLSNIFIIFLITAHFVRTPPVWE